MAKNNKTAQTENVAPDATTGNAPVINNVNDVRTDQTVNELNAEAQSIAQSFATLTFGTPEFSNANNRLNAIQLEIKKIDAAEKKAIADAEKEAQIEEDKTVLRDLLNGYSNAADDVAKEEAFNALFAKFNPAKKSVKHDLTNTNGKGIKHEILSLLPDLYAKGLNGKEVRTHIIKELGYNDGTANAAILSYERAVGIA